MEEIMQLAANYGFPMVVAGYLLVRLEPLIKELQKFHHPAHRGGGPPGRGGL